MPASPKRTTERYGKEGAGQLVERALHRDKQAFARVADALRSRPRGLRNLLSVTLSEKTLRKILPPMGLMRASNARNVRPQGPSVMRTQFPASPDDIDLTPR